MHCKQGEKDRERVKELAEKACMVDEHSNQNQNKISIENLSINVGVL